MANPRELTTRQYNLAAAVKRTTSGTSAATTNAIGYSEVLIFATQDAWITFGTSPTAAADTAGNILLKAGALFHASIDPTHKLAAIQDTTAGSVHIIPTT